MASCGYFFASLRQRSCSSQCRYHSVNAVTKMHCCSERKTAFVQPFCSTRCSANKSLTQRCFNVFCIVRVSKTYFKLEVKSIIIIPGMPSHNVLMPAEQAKKFTILYQRLKLWNSSPHSIIRSNNKRTFKRLLTSYLINLKNTQ